MYQLNGAVGLLLGVLLIGTVACQHEKVPATGAESNSNNPVQGELEPEQPKVVQETENLRILFIGNSLTYTYNLPRMLEHLFELGGVEMGRIDAIAYPNYGLPDHWILNDVRNTISIGDWDYVVLQQGPSATEGRPYLLEYAQIFDELIKKSGARSALYMVWPAKSRFFDFDGVLESYKTAAKLVDGLFLPAGEAWRVAWKYNQDLMLYGPDQFHPSALGTYLAALVMYQKFSGRDPRELPDEMPSTSWPFPVSEEEVRTMQSAAYEVNQRYP